MSYTGTIFSSFEPSSQCYNSNDGREQIPSSEIVPSHKLALTWSLRIPQGSLGNYLEQVFVL